MWRIGGGGTLRKNAGDLKRANLLMAALHGENAIWLLNRLRGRLVFKWTLPSVPAVVEVMQGYAWHARPVLFAMHGRGWMRLVGWMAGWLDPVPSLED